MRLIFGECGALMMQRFYFGGIIPGTKEGMEPIIHQDKNLVTIERPPLPSVNFKDIAYYYEKDLAVKYIILIGDYNEPICQFNVDYFMYYNGDDNTTTVRRRVYDFVQFRDQEHNYLNALNTNLPIENSNIVKACQALKKS